MEPGGSVSDATALVRRGLFFGLTFLTVALGSALMYDILRADGFTLIERGVLALFTILFTWITGAFWTALAGFVVCLRGGDPGVLRTADVAGRALIGRTVLLMPIYNEDPARVFAGLEVIWSQLVVHREGGAFDLFVLSDTRNSEIAAQEERAWAALVARQGAAGRIFYRRRRDNIGRKAGNIEDFVRAWGGAYDHAVVLDADSVMSAHALVTLARMMEAHPEAGIIQALPLPCGRDTLFARLIQFAARLNSPMLAAGLAWWQLGESNYWGHNAILRLRAFAAYCGLPRLPGRAPLGGEIMSHDFVEAALMRRAGCEVWLLADLTGSWEEVPSNVLDYAGRDRRWAQGNLQHLALLPARGFHWLSRLHLVTGVLSYVSSPLWLAILVLSSTAVCIDAIRGHQYFELGSHTLFPTWPEYRDPEIAALLSLTLGVLFAPKLLGTALALVKPALRRGFGGSLCLIVSVLLEQIFSTLLAPAMMMFHTAFVLAILVGRPVSWHAQERGDRGIGFREALACHRWHVLLGLAWAAVMLKIAPRYIWWVSPVVAGLILSVSLTMLTSRASLGRLARRAGLLLTPEETTAPPELAVLGEALTCEQQLLAPYHDLAATGTDARVRIARNLQAPRVPPRIALPMEAASLSYMTPRGALHKLQKLLTSHGGLL
jgi:membrane glycosyltransferase